MNWPEVPMAALRRAGWGLADQALSSLTNFALSFAVARSLGATQLGAFALAFGTFTFVQGVGRSLTSEPLVVRHSASPVTDWTVALRGAAGASVLFGAVAGAICLGIGTVLNGPLASGFLALGLCLPGLLLQDTWRFAFTARRRGDLAFVNDLIWTVCLGPLLAVVLLTGRATIVWFILAWGGAATVAAAAGVVQAGTAPRLSAAGDWLRRSWTLSRFLGPDSVVTSGAHLAAFYVIGWLGGLQSVGAIQAAGLLLGPLNILFMATGLVVIPELVRLAHRSVAAIRWAARVVALVLATLALAVGAVLYLVPDQIGHVLLGTAWTSARSVLIPMTIMTAGTGVMIGAQFSLKALGAARRSLASNLLSGSALVASTALGAAAGQEIGAAWGLAVGRGLGLVPWWLGLDQAIHRDHPQRVGAVAR